MTDQQYMIAPPIPSALAYELYRATTEALQSQSHVALDWTRIDNATDAIGEWIREEYGADANEAAAPTKASPTPGIMYDSDAQPVGVLETISADGLSGTVRIGGLATLGDDRDDPDQDAPSAEVQFAMVELGIRDITARLRTLSTDVEVLHDIWRTRF